MKHLFTLVFFLFSVGVAFAQYSSAKPASQSSPKVREFDVNGVAFNMVFVDGGTYNMGCTSEQGGECEDDELPVHKVTVSSFWMGETEVTQALWKSVMGEEPSWGLLPDYGVGASYPVYRITWHDCQNFIERLNDMTGLTFRLPTEAEWEFAARGGNLSKHYKYSGSNNIDEVACYIGNSNDRIHPVKKKKPNELGLYDMSGNVWEWCAEWYEEEYYSVSPSNNPTGPSYTCTHCVHRGGSWNYDPFYSRITNRGCTWHDEGYYNLGFRLVMVP